MKSTGKGEAAAEVIGECLQTHGVDARDLHWVRAMLMQIGNGCHRLSSRLAGISTSLLRLRSYTMLSCIYPRIPFFDFIVSMSRI